MANNKYRDRLEKKEPSPVLSFLHGAGKIVAVGGGIYGSYRTLKSTNAINKLMNSNAFHKTAEMARDRFYERRAYRSALKSTIQDVGFGRYMMGKGDDVLRTHLTRTMSDVAESKINKIGTTKTAFESLLLSTKSALTNAYELSVNERRLQIINAAKKEYVKSEEGNAFIEKLIGKRGNALKLSNRTYSRGAESKTMQEQIQAMAEEMGLDYQSIGDTTHAEIVKFAESAGAHLTKSKNDFIKDQQEQIQTILAKHKKNIYSSLYDSLSEINTATSKTMEALGAKRYTIGDFLSNPNMASQRGNDSQAFIEALNSHSIDSILNRKEKLKNSLDFAEAVFADMRSVLQDSREEKIRQMAVDTSLFKDTAGNPLDLRFIGEAKDAFFDNASEAFQVPLVKIRPFQTIGLFNKRSPAGRDFFSIFENGSYMPTLGSGPLQDDFYFFGDKAINSAGDVVFENARLAPKRGAWQRGYSAMFGATRHGDDERNFFMKTFDLGRQEDNNLLSGFNMWLNKRRDVNNSSTFVAAIENLKLVPSEEYTPFIYKKAYEIANRGTTNIDSETFDLLSKGMSHVDKDFQKILFGFSEDQTNEGIYNTLKTLTEKNLSAGFINSERMLQAYQNNPMGYDFQKNLKSIQMELLGIAKQSAGNYLDIVSIGSELYEKGQIGKAQLKNLSNIKAFMDLSISGDFQNPNNPVFGVKALNDIAGIFTKKPDLQFGETFQAIKSMAKEQDRFFSLESAPRRADAFEGNKHILVGKHRSLIKSINDGIKDGQDILGIANKLVDDGVFSQYWAGRKNPKNVTSTTLIPYYYLYRLNEGIASTGLALSNENMGSVGDIAKNLFTRRILGPAALITGVGYLNYEIGNLTGEEPSDVAAKAYAGTRLNFQRFKDITGINAFSRRWQKIMPGIDKTLGNPVGMALDAVTGGFIGEDKGYEALKFEYEKGFSPVRKGRFWSFGGETPFYGGRVEFHEVPWIRKVIGEPENTEVLYGSEDRKWANSWLPNPRNPLGILKRIFDPYYIENGTRDIRPYPTTGGIPELEAVPLVGPLLNATVGRIIKPPRKKAGLGRAHREYLREINEAITAQQGGGSAFVKLGQGGRASFVDISGGSFSEDIGQEYGGYGLPYRTIGAPGDQGMPFADISKNTISSSNVGYGAASSRQQLTAINLGIMSRAAVKQKPMTSISSLREAEYVANLDQAVDPNSTAYRLSETYYSMTEVGGIYGFLTQSVFGEMSPNIALADSSRIDSPQRKWWDRRMGGLGGDLSEIYRRFLPNKRNSIEEYNPFKNKMPDWLPGNEYFLDFKHGDPYCVSKDTLIEVNKLEFKRADEVKIGDIITTHTGRLMPVKNISIRKVKQKEKVYKFNIATINGIPASMSEEHPILIYDKDIGTNKWVEAKDVQEGNFVAYPILKKQSQEWVIDLAKYTNCSATDDWIYLKLKKDSKTAQVYEYMVENNILTFKRDGSRIMLMNKFQCNSKTIQTAQRLIKDGAIRIRRYVNVDEDIAYFFGLYLAEGSLEEYNARITLSLHKKEVEYAKKAYKGIKKIDPLVSEIIPYTKENCTNWRFSSKPIRDILLKLFKKLAKNKTIPQEFYSAKDTITYSFLKGYFDGDGSFGTYNKKFKISSVSASKILQLQIRKLALINGHILSLNKKEPREALILGKQINSSEAFTTTAYGKSGINFAKCLNYAISDEEINSNINNYFIKDGYLYLKVLSIKERTDIFEVYGFEVDIDDSFCVAGFATHNTKIPQGESLLVGAGYESVNDLNPDPFFNQYGALDRMKILGNAAPWSQQYKYYSKAVSLLHEKGYIDDEQYKEAQYTREMVRERKKPFDIYPYKFKYADDIEKKTVTISRIIDDTTFLTKEMPYSPIRLAGVELPNKDTPEGEKIRAYLSSILQPEKKIRIGINKDPLNQERSDTMETIRAAVFDSWGDPIQKKLVALGAEGNFDDPSAATTNALFSPFEIGLGKTWERFSHLDTPFHTKFLKIRSPLEHYKREYLYGKSFKKWSNPIRDWVVPTVENAATWNPLIASGFGAVIGAAASAVSPLSGFHSHSKLIGAAIGAMAFGVPSTLRAIGEIGGTMAGKGIDATFIPRRRQKERDLDEYIDKLKYIKYKGLYEKAARLAQKYEGFNPKDMEDYSGEMKLPSKMRKQLQETLRWLKIGKSDSASMDKEEAQQKIDIINTLLDGGDDLLLKVGPYTASALQYKKEYESTLHGADPHGDLMAIYAAMPKKDRPFMQHFMTAPPEEREEILRLVPKNQRRFYQAKWGLKEDKPENLAKFFSSHHLPGPNWAGWKPNVSLESVKLKIAKNEAMDIRDMGFWEQDEREAENAPEVKKFNSLKGLNIFNLQKALEGAGLKNTDIQIIKEDIDGQNDELDLNLDIKYDRKKDIRREINNNISTIFA